MSKEVAKNSTFLIIGSVMIAVAITLGAFGAHILNPGLEDKYIRTLATANQYNMIMSVALFGLAILMSQYSSLKRPFILIMIGTYCFSGSLFIIVLCKFFGSEIPGIVGPITPLGGLLMIIGWLWVVVNIKRSQALL